jgi:mycoredoxin
MLKVYAAKWCSHCISTVDYLQKCNVDFEYIEIEEQPEDIVNKVIEVNGGDDWVVPTLEFNGKWRPGRVYNEIELGLDLKRLGVSIF